MGITLNYSWKILVILPEKVSLQAQEATSKTEVKTNYD